MLNNSTTPFQSMEISQTLSYFDVSQEKGLSDDEASRRLQQFGKNDLAQKKAFQFILDFLTSFFSPLMLLLIFASAISAALGDIRDFFVILTIILISGTISFYQNFTADRQAKRLQQKVLLTATVLRNGIKKEVPFSHVTLGDIVLLNVGDLVPADCRILETKDFSIDESVLTGESFPAEKSSASVQSEKESSSNLDLNKQNNMVFMGTHVVSGEGTVVVVRVGKQTEFGKLSLQIEMKKPLTAFDISLNKFGYLLLKATLALTLFVFLVNFFLKHEFLNSFLFSLSLAVGLTPELLPVILTVNLAKGATKMGKKEVIVKYLPAIQNLGSMDILCTDKTGTLTENTIALKSYEDAFGKENESILRFACANGFFQSGFKNPLDTALLTFAGKTFAEHFEKVDEIPFDFERKRLSVILKEKSSGKLFFITKGEYHSIYPLITSYQKEKKTVKVSSDFHKHLQKTYEDLSKQGLRVVTLAYKEVKEQKSFESSDEKGLTFLGFLTFVDPAKKGVAITVQELEHLGITVKILTGDNELITRKVCEDAHIPVDGVLLGHEIEKLSDTELQQTIEKTTIFARLTPEQKSHIIKAFQKQHVVGYLGDGINDAPPLKAADVGISVNNGSDAARDVADIILMKKSLFAVKEGVLDGRQVYANILKYIMMGTSSNFGNMFSVAGASLFLSFLPMLPIQILLNNLLYDTSQLAIPTDNVDREGLNRPRKWDISFIKKFMIIFGPISSLFDFLTFFLLLYLFHASIGLFQTGWFVESLVTQTLIILSIRTFKIPFFKSKPSFMMIFSAVVVSIVAIVLPYIAFGQYFSFVRLPAMFYFLLTGIVVLYFLVVEQTKRWFYRKHFN